MFVSRYACSVIGLIQVVNKDMLTAIRIFSQSVYFSPQFGLLLTLIAVRCVDLSLLSPQRQQSFWGWHGGTRSDFLLAQQRDALDPCSGRDF